MDTNNFLRAVLGTTGYYCLFASNSTNSKRVQRFYEDVDVLVEEALDLDSLGYDVYFGLAEFNEKGSRKADNVKSLRSFFLDLDCGASKDYPTKKAAIIALQEFCETLSLPKPLCIDSGRGIHCYWPLSDNIPPDDWVPVAEKLKALCAKHKFYADPAVTADIARVLRVPATHNHKTTPPADVFRLKDKGIKFFDFDDFAKLLGVNTILPPTKAAPTGSNAVMDALLGNREASFFDILKRTKAGRGCEQLRVIVTDQENTSEPMWRAGLSIARFCADGEKAAHLLSQRHSNYDEEATNAKFGPIKGPYTCAKFDEFNPDICPECPNWGQVKSPIVLGNRYKRAETSSQDIPEYPHPYFRGENGGVYIRLSNNDGDIDEKCIYHNDLYVIQRVVDAEFGESVVMRLHLPKDGIREFTLPLSAVTSRDEFRKTLSAQGVAVMKMDDLMAYTTTWINELQANGIADEAHRQFGWTNDKHEAFILGNQKILPNSLEFNAPSNQTLSLFPAFEPKGSLDKWKETIDFWNRDGFELYQYVTGIGFGSVLMEFANVNCSALHLHSKASGVAKTTAMAAAVSVWGDPSYLVIKQADTYNSKMNRGEVYHSLPWAIDEITNIAPKMASDLLYQFTDGMQRNRMSQGGNVERVRGRPWKLMAVTTGNTSIIERVCIAKSMPKAEAARVLECYVPDIKDRFDNKRETDTFEEDLKANYGHAGVVFIQCVMNNLEEVQRCCREVQEYVDTKGGLTAENRFWSAQITFTIVGIIWAKRAGLINFDVSKIFKWALEVLLPQNKNSNISIDASVFDIMNDFFSEHFGNILQIKSSNDNRKLQNNGLDDHVVPDVIAKGKLVARYEPDTQKFFVVPKVLKSWCGEQQINYSDLVKQIKDRCEGKRAKVRLSKGTSLNLPPADVLVMKFAIGTDDSTTEP
tara:strand:+ start:8601 stop:11369 length:2769 start_codon:yes stop_codon:yes gene_type:complete